MWIVQTVDRANYSSELNASFYLSIFPRARPRRLTSALTLTSPEAAK